jgi:REP element-mobilizing transposase RayT
MSYVRRKPGVASLRKGRFSSRNQIYHVSTRTIGRESFFRHFCSGRAVVRTIAKEEGCGHIRTLAFVVMPDHLHWLVQLRTDRSLSVAVNRVKSQSAIRINKQLCRSGAIWQKGFYDRALRRDEDVVGAARYIIANPLRAHIVRNIGDYPHWDAIWLQCNRPHGGLLQCQ